MESIKIIGKIVGQSVKKGEQAVVALFNPITMSEHFARPDALEGKTYKIKPGDHALYITINDVVLNAGTDHEQRRPYEVFINTKAVEHSQYIVTITRLLSAVFRKGGDPTFVIEEMKSVFDPKGGYWLPGGKFMNSVVAHIGSVIEDHMIALGLLSKPALTPEAKAEIAKKIEAMPSGWRANASVCGKCSERAVILLDGCMTCTACGDGKCG